MNLADKAFLELYPGKEKHRSFEVAYSGRFNSFNGNVRYTRNKATFSLSKSWKDFSEDLQIGFLQYLLVKIYDYDYKKTFHMDLYDKFINNLSKYAKVEVHDEDLEESFDRVNDEYFSGLMDKPNLKWGNHNFRKMGHYEYTTNTVMISEILRENDILLDYVMYHELLHKKHGLKTTKTGRNVHHSKAFKEDEKRFKVKDIEKKLSSFVAKKRLKNMLRFRF